MPEENIQQPTHNNHPGSLPPLDYEQSAPVTAAVKPVEQAEEKPPAPLQDTIPQPVDSNQQQNPPQQEQSVKPEPKLKKPGFINKIFSSKNSLAKTIFINSVNLGLIFGIVFLLGSVNARAEKVSELRNESLTSQDASDVTLLEAEIKNESERISYLRNYMGDESRVLDYLQPLDEMKAAGEINNYDLLTTQPTTDKSKNKGFPISIDILGSIDKINFALNKLDEMDFLVRPVSFNLNKLDEENYELTYGIFFYIYE